MKMKMKMKMMTMKMKTKTPAYTGTVCTLQEGAYKDDGASILIGGKETEYRTGPAFKLTLDSTDFCRFLFYFQVEHPVDLFGAKIRFELFKIDKHFDWQTATVTAHTFKLSESLLINFLDVLSPGFGGQEVEYIGPKSKLRGKFIKIVNIPPVEDGLATATAEVYLGEEPQGYQLQIFPITDLTVL